MSILLLLYFLAIIYSLFYFGAIRPEEINLCSKINLNILVSEGNITGALEEVSRHVHKNVDVTSGSYKVQYFSNIFGFSKNSENLKDFFFTWVITTERYFLY